MKPPPSKRWLILATLGGLAYPFAVYFGHGVFPAIAFVLAGMVLVLLRLVGTGCFAPAPGRIFPFAAAFLVLGGLTIGSPALAVQAYPVLVSLAVATLFGLSLIFPPTIVERIARLAEPNLPADGVRYTRRVTVIWLVFLLLNALISTATALWGTLAQWTLWNGLLSYLAMGLLFAGEFIVRGFVRRRAPARATAAMSWRLLSTLMTEGRADNHPVALSDGTLLTFERFRHDVAKAAHHLAPVERAALVCRNSYAFAVGLFGLLHAGAGVVLPANNRPGTLSALSGTFDRLVDDAILKVAPGLNMGPGEEKNLTPLDAERPCIDFFTSGSTGAPKCISKSIGMLEREIATFKRHWPDGLGKNLVQGTVPHHHLYGLTFKLLWPLAAGIPFDAAVHEVWETLLATLTPGAVLIASPAHLERLGGIEPLPPACRPHRIFCAGAPLSAGAARQTEAILGPWPDEIFGSTETGAFATRRQIVGHEPWTLLPGNDIRIEADGRMSVRSPHLPDWVLTHDRVEAEAGGFNFRGRADRVVKIEGKRVGLSDVEQALIALPWVETAAVALRPGSPARLVAVVVVTPAGQARLTELGNFRFGRLLRAGLADTQELSGMPRHWRFVDALPQGALGKRQASDILALFGEEA